MALNTLSFRDDCNTLEENAWKPDPCVVFIFEITPQNDHMHLSEGDHLNMWLTNYVKKE